MSVDKTLAASPIIPDFAQECGTETTKKGVAWAIGNPKPRPSVADGRKSARILLVVQRFLTSDAPFFGGECHYLQNRFNTLPARIRFYRLLKQR